MSLTLTFEIRFTSNYHSGAGYGKGFGLDSALLREADGTPVLRGSALAGLLRGAAYQLLAHGPLQNHNRSDVLNRLFGSPSEPKIWSFSSARSEKRSDDAEVVRRARIDPRVRRAEARKLFSQEEGKAGQVFCFTVTCPASDNPALDDAALLVAAARYVRQLGRSRRRGLGECVIKLTGVDGVRTGSIPEQSCEDWFLERFKSAWMDGKPAERGCTPAQYTELPSVPASNGAAVRVRLVVRLDEPVLIAERAPAGNQYDARIVIPGSVVLGALATLAADGHNLADADVYRDFVRLFLRQSVLFPTLYPAWHHNNFLYPSIPAPLGLMTCKVQPWRADQQGHAVHSAWSVSDCPTCHSRLEPVSGFVELRKNAPYTFSPGRSSELHIQISEDTQRVKSGQLYGYTVLDAGQYYVGELACADESIWSRLKEMTGIVEQQPLICRLGKARRRGYGQVTVWAERCDDRPHLWIQLPLKGRLADVSKPFSLTLLSDTVIVNSWGQQAVGFSADWLTEVLGLGQVEVIDAYARTRVVDGFNATLGLPRWRDTALVAGSVAWLKLSNPSAGWQDQMERLEAQGIGLRRNEGFGRLAFNHPLFDNRDALNETDIQLPDAMRLPPGRTRDAFARWWVSKLDEKLSSKFRNGIDERFGVLARWLHANSHKSPENLCVEAEKMGEPNKVLVDTIGASEHGSRRKENFFSTGAGEAAFRAMLDALEFLKDEEPQNWAFGVELLAEKIVALSRQKEQEEK